MHHIVAMGRPSKLTPELVEKLAEIADGVPTIKEACDHLDITYNAWSRWETQDVVGDVSEHLLAKFRELANTVRAKAGDNIKQKAWGVLGEVMESGSEAARVTAASNILRLQTAHEVRLTGAGGGPIQIGPKLDLSKLSVNELRAMRELVEKAGGKPDGVD